MMLLLVVLLALRSSYCVAFCSQHQAFPSGCHHYTTVGVSVVVVHEFLYFTDTTYNEISSGEQRFFFFALSLSLD